MPSNNTNAIYSSKIIKAGALIADTKTLLDKWDDSISISENLHLFRHENVFGKASRSRVEDILLIFRQRYLQDEAEVKALVALVKHDLPAESLDRILYFYSARSDQLLHDVVTVFLTTQYENKQLLVTVQDIENWIREQIALGKTKYQWAPKTITRSAQELMSTLRDFGVLQGTMTKHISPAYLPVSAFAFIAFNLWKFQASGGLLLEHPDWRLFFLSAQAIERFFIEAHQHHLLYYQAAGSITRVDFPVDTFEEYTLVIAERTY